jgi:hypothetical protein
VFVVHVRDWQEATEQAASPNSHRDCSSRTAIAGVADESQQARGEDPGDLAGALLGAEMLGRNDVGPHRASGFGAAHSGLRVTTGALPGGIEERASYLLTTRLGFEMTGGGKRKVQDGDAADRNDGEKQKAARLYTGRPWFRGLRYDTTWSAEGSRTRRFPEGPYDRGTTSAGSFQSAVIGTLREPTAGLKQPSSRCVTSQTLGRRNAAPVQNTSARPGTPESPPPLEAAFRHRVEWSAPPVAFLPIEPTEPEAGCSGL